MQPRPTASELLQIVAQVLDEEVVPTLDGPVQHRARVAASLVGIVERELRLGPAADARERDVLRALIGSDSDHVGDDLPALRAELAAQLRAGRADDPAVEAEVWKALMELVRADLAIVKPGHDSWDGR